MCQKRLKTVNAEWLSLRKVSTRWSVLDIANKGWKVAVKEDNALAKGVNAAAGKITSSGVAEAHGLTWVPISEVL